MKITAKIGAAGLAAFAAFANDEAAAEATYSCPSLALDAVDTEEYGRIVQGADGWFFRTAADLTWRFHLAAEAQSHIARLVDALAKRDTTLGFVIIPPRGLVSADTVDRNGPGAPILTTDEGAELYRAFIAGLEEAGAIAPDLLAAMRVSDAQFFFKRDHHWTPEGARIAAFSISDAARADGRLDGFDGATFVTETPGSTDLKGGMAQVVSRYCDDVIPPEKHPAYETIRQASDAADLGLFGDAEEGTSIALIGTSFSDVAAFNFDGFLSEAFGVAVANYAISGGGFETSPISYFSSTAFQESAPNLLIWEMPVYYDVSGSSLEFRQMIPAVGGACAPEDAVAAFEGVLSDNPSLTLPAAANISGASHFVYVEVDDPTVAAFTLNIDYADGDREDAPINREGRFRNEGRFFLEFSPDIASSVTSVTFNAPEGADVPLKMMICPSTEIEAAKRG